MNAAPSAMFTSAVLCALGHVVWFSPLVEEGLDVVHEQVRIAEPLLEGEVGGDDHLCLYHGHVADRVEPAVLPQCTADDQFRGARVEQDPGEVELGAGCRPPA